MWTGIAGFLGGMGLFFVGLKLTGEGVKKITGRRFRDLFLKCTRRTPTAALLGLAAGFVFQSTSGIAVILSSLIDAGATTLPRALSVLFGAYIGLSGLVLLAVVDIKVLVLLLLGVSGLILAFERPARLVHVATIAYGVAMLLFGLQTVRVGVAPLAQASWFIALFSGTGMPLPVFFGLGALACLLLHNVTGVVILAITMAASGVMSGNAALAVYFGSLFGSAILGYLYALGYTGVRKRLAMGQILYTVVGLALFLPIFALETTTGQPLLLGQAQRYFPTLAEQLTGIGIAYNVVTSLLLLAFKEPYSRLLTAICPDKADSLASLTYARELADVSPDTGLLLINQEQGRIMRHLPTYAATLRPADRGQTRQSPLAIHKAVENLSQRIEECLLDMVSFGHAGNNATAIALLQANQAAIRAADDTLVQLVTELSQPAESASFEHLRAIFLEALDVLLLQAGDVFCEDDAFAWDIFLRLVSDKGPAMERLRGRYLHEQTGLSREEQWRLMHMTGLYDRCAWLLRRLAEQQHRFLRESGRESSSMACGLEVAPSVPLA